MKRVKTYFCILAALVMVFTDAAVCFGGLIEASASEARAGTVETGAYTSKLPVIYINTENSQAITSKEDYINAELKIQGNDQYHADNTTLYDGTVKIRGRGNSTWANPKKPYKIKLDTKTDLFGFGSNKHWVLLANYTDESHLRNILSYNLSGEMGMPYMQSVHVDLVLNGKYQGTYQFCEQIKIAKKRVNIHDWEDFAGDVAKAVVSANKNVLTADDQDAIEKQLAETDMGWLTAKKFKYKNAEYDIAQYLDMPDATGGFLLELDAYFDEYSKFRSSKDQPIQFKSPEFIATNQTALNYVKNYINAFEQAISAEDYTVDYDGKTVTYSQLFDMDSLVQFWLVNELFMNVDAMKKSTYLYKDIDGPFYMGPIWDMDWSSNSLVSAGQGSASYDTWQTVKYSDGAQASQWYKSIIRDPYFAVRAYEWYQQMKPSIEKIVAEGGTIDTYEALLSESAGNNYTEWYSGEFYQNKEFHTQVKRLKTYLTNRIHWMDKQFASPETLAASLGYQAAGGVAVDSENIQWKDSATVTIPANVTNSGVVSAAFLVNGKKIGVSDVAEGKAAIDVPKSELKDSGFLNTVQVLGVNASGSVVTSGTKKVMDFAAFETPADQKPGEGGDDNKPGEDDNKPGEDDNKPGEGDSKPGEGGDDNKPGEGGDGNKPGEGEDGNKPGSGSVPSVSAVTFEKKAVTVPKGTAAALRATVTAQAGADKTVTYISSDPAVAQVGANGVVTGKKRGTAVVTASAGKASDSCTVTVSDVTLNVASAPMQKKQTTKEIQIKSRYPANDTVAFWNSSDTGVASVNSKGKITAKKTGTAVVTVTMKSGAKASCKIRVIKGKVKTKKLSVAKKTIRLQKGKTFQIVPVRTPVTANDKVSYSVSGKKVIRVSSKGKVKALKKGSAKVIVKAGGKKIQVKVNVR